MSKVLTFDLGTTNFKACLFDHEARPVARHRIVVPVSRPAPDRVELPIAVFCRCLVDAVHELGRQVGGLRDVMQISFASQANSFTLFDKHAQPLIPFLLWTDERARHMTAALADFNSLPEFSATTGVAVADHLFLPAKIAWLHQHQPSVMSQATRLCSLGDYLIWWLTGNHLTEWGLAGLTGVVDIRRMEYWNKALQAIDLPLEWLPKIVRAGGEAGRIRSEIADELGLARDCRVRMGCLDQYSGAIGAGNVRPGSVSETTGTVLATVCCADSYAKNLSPTVFQGPAYTTGIYYQMVFSSLSAGLLERYRNQLTDNPSFAELDELAAAVPAGAEGMRLHPEARRNGEEMFIHRSGLHHRGHEVRAILEAVAHELRGQVALLCGENWPRVVWAAGGGANSKLWLQIKSDVLGCPVRAVDCPEPTSLGAAKLALGQLE